jgi:Tc toxin complex TcA C-terminal TcB-binding domain
MMRDVLIAQYQCAQPRTLRGVPEQRRARAGCEDARPHSGAIKQHSPVAADAGAGGGQARRGRLQFERDTELHLIREAYFDKDRKDYTAAESLLRELDGLDYVDITGRTQKAMQLSHAVSLRKHYLVSFMALQLAGGARFTTTLKEFDRWFPSTYSQRIKEIRVEVLIEGKPVPARGYLANDGVSMVRSQDTGNKRPVDNMHVFAEPDEDIAKLC